MHSPDERLWKLLAELSARARGAGTELELAFVLANESIALINYDQAVVTTAQGDVVSVSAVSAPDRRAPFSLFMQALTRDLVQKRAEITAGSAGELASAQQDDWAEWLPPCGLWIPPAAGGWAVLMVRERPFTQSDIVMAEQVAGLFRHARAALVDKRRGRAWFSLKARRSHLRVLLMSAVLLAVGMLPVSLSVLAPAEIVAVRSLVVRSPVEGVVERIHVRPNQVVREGQLLVEMNTTAIRGRLAVAERELLAANAEYRQIIQLAVSDVKARGQIAILKARTEIRILEVAYLKDLQRRSRVVASREGLTLLDDPRALVGRPVAIGERLLEIADEREIEVEAWVGLHDIIEISEGTRVFVVLNAEPLSPLSAQVRYLSYEPMSRPGGTAGYRLRATLEPDARLPRLGARGTARIDGATVPLAYWLFRRPMAAIRQFLGI